MQRVFLKVFVFLFRVLRNLQLFCECLSKWKYRFLVKKSKLIPLCENRWAEIHDYVITFVELLPAIYKTLASVRIAEPCKTNS